ncbi:MAG TPA: GNAT family N-acetyltransferase [Hyphomonadaceae bacterium]|nr:GNAT family N-acetyltransferase [Hyphomonadaceae bacterium]
MSGKQARETIGWERGAELREEAARFFAANIKGAAAYISHGEVQGGLSLDGKTWAKDLEARFVEDMLDDDPDEGILVVRDAEERMIAASIVHWVATKRLSFAVIEDIAVPARRRSSGLGARMMAFIEAEAARRGCRWLFLESGRRNTRAHAFFERHGFEEFSHVFLKPVARKKKR